VKVSVVVATYRRERRLCQMLGDVLELEWPDLEVIVVDQSERHEPETERFLDAVSDRLVYLHGDRPSQVAALNRGVGVAHGEVVLCLDDDVRIRDRHLVDHHVENYSEPAVGAVAGRVLDAECPREGAFDPRSAHPVWGFFHSGWTHRRRCEVSTAPGANVSFRREVLLALGGADERFAGNAFRWENDLCLRVRAAGYTVVYDPRPTVHHFYGSAGGAENRHLHGRGPGSHRWYRDFFHNHVYLSLTHMPRATLAPLLWRLYRGHVLNRPYAGEGFRFLARRHRAMVEGVVGGWLTYRGARRDRRRARP
jgi:GT2 family glycosyltransferase